MTEFTRQLKEKNITTPDAKYLEQVILLVRDRLVFLNDFWDQAAFFFQKPVKYDLESVKQKWTDPKTEFFQAMIESFRQETLWLSADIEQLFKSKAEEKGIKIGELMLPFRIMLVGGKFGPQVFEIAALIGQEETIGRIKKGLLQLE